MIPKIDISLQQIQKVMYTGAERAPLQNIGLQSRSTQTRCPKIFSAQNNGLFVTFTFG